MGFKLANSEPIVIGKFGFRVMSTFHGHFAGL
jgi:hypothetical protein